MRTAPVLHSTNRCIQAPTAWRRSIRSGLAWLACAWLAACGGGSSPTPASTPGTPASTSYSLGVSVTGSGAVSSSPTGISCGSTCSASFASGTSVTLTATPASGATFQGWGGACSGSSSCSVAMSQARQVTASFVTSAPASYALSVSVSGNGAITSSPVGIDCGATCVASFTSGAVVVLTASPVSGNVFSGWGGACSGSAATCTITMSQTQSATAAFAGSAITLSSHLFAPTSFWYQPIPANAPLNANSATYAQNLASQVKTYYGNVNLNTDTYAAPVYYVQTSGTPYTTTSDPNATPLFQVGSSVNVAASGACNSSNYSDPRLAAQWQGVPIPAGATVAKGTDKEMDIYDISTQTFWEFWVMSNTNGQWSGCWGGRIQDTSQSDGIFPNPFGGSATGLPYQAGEITAAELASGNIDHVMGIAIVNADSWNVFSWPANRSDGYNPNNAPGQIPEGIRFRLDPAINVDALNLNPIARTIAIAAQKYGFVVWDKGGSVTLRLSNPMSYQLAGKANPYAALFGNTASYAIMNGFPWDKVQFMPVDYGKPAAAAATASMPTH